ncbi:MAG: hypothetical protein A3K19_25885 [Lentisphaerae bacterium RIFOXYB12_FULL_65_16]|nr:MAG: hypothetical protein A3K18_31885 [Lentisphaerae bacterium RIFOXYA12_64_32]OGV91402.1 MAG: hypothetical protein A3K19_25885 [Lentisphaerae bacterium RIFOXYB12_FULL_65_16]
MTRNVTLRMDEELLTKLRHHAVDERMSLSAWVVAVLQQTAEAREQRTAARQRALRRLGRGFRLGGKPLSREQSHAR